MKSVNGAMSILLYQRSFREDVNWTGVKKCLWDRRLKLDFGFWTGVKKCLLEGPENWWLMHEEVTQLAINQ